MPNNLPPKPKKLDELSFSDFMKRVPIAEFKREWVPAPVRVAGKFTRWHNRRSLGDPNMQYFKMKSEITNNTYVFLTRVDWRGLFVPLVLVPPDLPADTDYREYHRYAKPEDLTGESAIKEVCRKLVTEFERSEWARLNPECEPFHKFYSYSHRERPVPFLTRPGWKGLWIHEVISEDAMPIEPQKPSYRVYKTVEEIQGEKEVRRAARGYLAIFENVQRGTQTQKSRKLATLTLNPKRSTMLKDVQNFLSHASRMEITGRQGIYWALENAWKYMVPEDFKSAHLIESTDTDESDDLALLGTESEGESSAKDA